jgi:hypothetical protein
VLVGDGFPMIEGEVSGGERTDQNFCPLFVQSTRVSCWLSDPSMRPLNLSRAVVVDLSLTPTSLSLIELSHPPSRHYGCTFDTGR